MATHYEVLGVSPSASEAELKRAYQRRTRETHPDVTGSSDTTAFRAVQEAWEALKDAQSRERYDRTLRKPTYTPSSPQEPAYGSYGQGGVYVSADTFMRMAEEIRRMEEEAVLRQMEMRLQQEQIDKLMKPGFPLYGRVFSWAVGWYAGSYQAGVQYERAARWKRWDALVSTLLLLGLITMFGFSVLNAVDSGDPGTAFFSLIALYMGLGVVVISGFLGMWGYRWFRWVLRPNLRQYNTR